MDTPPQCTRRRGQPWIERKTKEKLVETEKSKDTAQQGTGGAYAKLKLQNQQADQDKGANQTQAAETPSKSADQNGKVSFLDQMKERQQQQPATESGKNMGNGVPER